MTESCRLKANEILASFATDLFALRQAMNVIAGLALLVLGGTLTVWIKLSGVNAQVGTQGVQIAEIANRMSRIDDQMTRIDGQVARIDGQMAQMNAQVAQMDAKLNLLLQNRQPPRGR